MASSLDYEQMFLLDAEELAEAGLKSAYETLLPELMRLVKNPVTLEEHIDSDAPRYAVVAGDTRYVIYAPELEGSEASSWGRATWALFTIVNQQLEHAE